MPIRRFVLLALAASACPGVRPARAQTAGLTVFAAASLKNALDDVSDAWILAGHAPPRLSFAGSNALARQIEAGAPADVFVSADLDWMDELDGKGLLRPGTRTSLLANALVLVAPRDSATTVAVGPGMDLAAALGPDGRLAMANVEAVPAGRYGKAALEALGAWAGVKNKVAGQDSVRSALLLVSRGEAPLGIVYATDAVADPNVKVLGTFPADSHPPIVYPAAIVKDARSREAAPFIAFLRGPQARAAFDKQGFTVLPDRRSPS